MSKRIDLKGRRFNNLEVLEFSAVKNTQAMWKVKCDCGTIFVACSSNLLSRNTTKCKACGKKTHGMSRTKFYKKYQVMMKKQKNISDDWKTFEGFKKDTYSSYKEGYTLSIKTKFKELGYLNCFWTYKIKGKIKTVEFDYELKIHKRITND